MEKTRVKTMFFPFWWRLRKFTPDTKTSTADNKFDPGLIPSYTMQRCKFRQ